MDLEQDTVEAPTRKARAGKRAGGGKLAKAGAKGGAKAGGRAAGKAAGMGKGKAQGEGADATQTAKRAGKRRRVAEANTVTFILETEVRKFMNAQARAAGMDIAPFMQKLVENHVVANAAADDPLVQRLTAKRAVLDRIVELSRAIDETEGFDEHFILKVMKRASTDDLFMRNYAAAVTTEGGNEKAAARAKAPINQQMGRLIKRAAGAKSKRDNNGKIQRAQVQGEMITTYTLLEKA